MPVKAGLSELQRLHASKARAESLLGKVRLHRVQGVLADQSTLYEVEQFLIEKGKLEVLNLGPKEKQEVKQMIEDDPNRNVNRENDSEAEWDDDKKFGRNVSKYKDLAFNTFTRGLRKANPSVFTKANLAALRIRGQRQASISSIAMLVDFVTDINPEDTIDVSLRTKAAIINDIADRASERKDRQRGLVLPPKYNKCGPFEIKSQGGSQVDVKCRFTRSTETVKVARGAKCYLDQEHSFLRCTLRVAGSSFKKILYPLFESAVDAERSSGLSSRAKPRFRCRGKTLAIGDKTTPQRQRNVGFSTPTHVKSKSSTSDGDTTATTARSSVGSEPAMVGNLGGLAAGSDGPSEANVEQRRGDESGKGKGSGFGSDAAENAVADISELV